VRVCVREREGADDQMGELSVENGEQTCDGAKK